MKKELESVKFILTDTMALQLIKFNELKKELIELKKLYNLDKNKQLLLQIKELEKQMNKCRNIFIKEFRINNHDEIIEYLTIKDQN